MQEMFDHLEKFLFQCNMKDQLQPQYIILLSAV